MAGVRDLFSPDNSDWIYFRGRYEVYLQSLAVWYQGSAYRLMEASRFPTLLECLACRHLQECGGCSGIAAIHAEEGDGHRQSAMGVAHTPREEQALLASPLFHL